MRACLFCDSPSVKNNKKVKSFDLDFISLFWKYFSFSDSASDSLQSQSVKNQHYQKNKSSTTDDDDENCKSNSNSSQINHQFCEDCNSHVHQLNQLHHQIQKVIAHLSTRIILLSRNSQNQNDAIENESHRNSNSNSKECQVFRTQVVNRLSPRVILDVKTINSTPVQSQDTDVLELKTEPTWDNEQESPQPTTTTEHEEQESNDIEDFEPPSPITSDEEEEEEKTSTKTKSKKRKRNTAKEIITSPKSNGEKIKKRKINHVENLGNGKFLYMGKEYEEKGRLGFRCSTCTKYNKSKSGMLRHISQLHTQGDFTCTSCIKSFPSESLLISHVCSYIQIGMRILEPEPGKFLLDEKWSFERDEENRMKCSICAWTTKTKEGMSDHIKVKHANFLPFVCHICAKAFFLKQFLESHMSTHSTRRDFLCDKCASSFKCRHDLLKHSRLIHSDKVFYCPDCGVSCKNSVVLNRHRKTRCAGKTSQTETTETNLT